MINKGVIAEQGTHEELLKVNGVYKKLVLRQLEKNAGDIDNDDDDKADNVSGDVSDIDNEDDDDVRTNVTSINSESEKAAEENDKNKGPGIVRQLSDTLM